MLKKPTLLYLGIILIAISMNAAAQTGATGGFLLQNERQLSALKNQYKAGDSTVRREIRSLLADADKILTAGPYSVTLNKTKIAPSGNSHDYVSQAPYWWPDPSKPDGKPYIRKDGERNPEIATLHDDSQLNKLCQGVKKLGFAYYFTGDERYAQKAANLMKIWFIDTATKMAPNLNYAQFIPGINDGRGIGIIESRGLTSIPDVLAMMQNSRSATADLINGVRQWFAAYLKWLQESKNGQDEKKSQNNHGTFYDVQVIDFAIFCGEEQVARDVLESRAPIRMDTQFTTDGRQPLELARTKSWGYSSMNLDGWIKLALLADVLHIDLWHTQTKDGKGIKKCITWLMPYLLKQQPWTYKQIEPVSYRELLAICSQARSHYPELNLKKVFSLYPEPEPWM
jgi:hypothetical protein